MVSNFLTFVYSTMWCGPTSCLTSARSEWLKAPRIIKLLSRGPTITINRTLKMNQLQQNLPLSLRKRAKWLLKMNQPLRQSHLQHWATITKDQRISYLKSRQVKKKSQQIQVTNDESAALMMSISSRRRSTLWKLAIQGLAHLAATILQSSSTTQ